MNSTGENLTGKFLNYIPQSVFYDTKDQIWIVSFWEDIDNYIRAVRLFVGNQAKSHNYVKICDENHIFV